MNCVKGDLAVIVSVPRRELQEQIGKFVRVVRPATSWDGFPCWILETPMRDYFGTCIAVADRDLRPIRPQPDEAVDEILQLVGAHEGLVGVPGR